MATFQTSLRKLTRRYQCELEQQSNGKWRITTPGGGRIFCAQTPTNATHALRNIERDISRVLDKEHVPTIARTVTADQRRTRNGKTYTVEHDEGCDDDGWDHPGPCVIETADQPQPATPRKEPDMPDDKSKPTIEMVEENHTTASHQRLWSDGTIDYACSWPGCKFAADTLPSVGAHYKRHSGKAAQRRRGETVSTKGTVGEIAKLMHAAIEMMTEAVSMLGSIEDQSKAAAEAQDKLAELRKLIGS